jgi:radical SAM protein with 4Fe4S-binding SPASM domain
MNAIFAFKELLKRLLPKSAVKVLTRLWPAIMERLPVRLKSQYRALKWDQDFHKKHFPITVVAIETVGNCNRECVYCPVSVVAKRKGRMSTEIFESIIVQLRDLGYKGEIYMHFFNEPLLDTRVVSFLRFIRKNLRENFLKFVTNGDLLTTELAREFFDIGVDILAVSLHDAALEEKANAIYAELPPEMKTKMERNRYYDLQNHEYDSRAGAIVSDDFKVVRVAEVEGCDKTEFIIDYQGNVHPCSEDIGQGYVLGNVNELSLYEIWDRNRGRFRDHFTGNFCQVCRQCVGLEKTNVA